MRGLGVWVGGSTALACAVMAVVLYLSDLETLSLLAGSGSFLTAVPSLVLAVLLARSPEPTPPAQRQQTGPADSAGPAVFELSTFAIRLSNRVSAALQGVALGAGIVLIILVGWTLSGDLELRLTEIEAGLPGSAIGLSSFMVFFSVLFFCCGNAFITVGRDALVVDSGSLAVIDQRRVRMKDGSFSLTWEELESVRLAADPGGGAHLLLVTFKDSGDGTDFARKHELTQADGGYVVCRLLLGTALEERTALLPQLRRALAHYGRSKFQG
ncbi:hypothetical protein [Streptomyces albidus (ex Kaewkla and Franco 2022)]|uniref:hypothetical protein n=1 Tax=Streptomyces albidus (ex Kaewkla and Franco 2022) TaxID=722709 RepID=UPI0015EEC6EE|nr:hypothetical protein [Streptomyces albidus (ex Kaewkla and Franco 2022)]